jgi:hypothetical protein
MANRFTAKSDETWGGRGRGGFRTELRYLEYSVSLNFGLVLADATL